MFQKLISEHMETPASKCAILEKIKARGRGEVEDIRFGKKPSSKFWIFHFTIGNFRESKPLPLQSCMTLLGNSKGKTQERWKLRMNFS